MCSYKCWVELNGDDCWEESPKTGFDLSLIFETSFPIQRCLGALLIVILLVQAHKRVEILGHFLGASKSACIPEFFDVNIRDFKVQLEPAERQGRI